jgi:hypothetical protein
MKSRTTRHEFTDMTPVLNLAKEIVRGAEMRVEN